MISLSREWKDHNEKTTYSNLIKVMLGFLVGLNILFPSIIHLISAPYYFDYLLYLFYGCSFLGLVLLSVAFYSILRDSESVPEVFLSLGNWSVILAFIFIVSYFFLNIYNDRHSKPYIKSINFSQTTIYTNTRISITANVIDEDNDRLKFEWSYNEKNIGDNKETIFWTTPKKEGNYTIYLDVSDDMNKIQERILIPVMRDIKKG